MPTSGASVPRWSTRHASDSACTLPQWPVQRRLSGQCSASCVLPSTEQQLSGHRGAICGAVLAVTGCLPRQLVCIARVAFRRTAPLGDVGGFLHASSGLREG